MLIAHDAMKAIRLKAKIICCYSHKNHKIYIWSYEYIWNLDIILGIATDSYTKYAYL